MELQTNSLEGSGFGEIFSINTADWKPRSKSVEYSSHLVFQSRLEEKKGLLEGLNLTKDFEKIQWLQEKYRMLIETNPTIKQKIEILQKEDLATYHPSSYADKDKYPKSALDAMKKSYEEKFPAVASEVIELLRSPEIDAEMKMRKLVWDALEVGKPNGLSYLEYREYCEQHFKELYSQGELGKVVKPDLNGLFEAQINQIRKVREEKNASSN